MVDVRSVSPVLTSGTHLLSISGNQQALTKDIATPADIAATALGLRTIIFYCFMGYISALTYYLLLLISRNEKREKVSDGGNDAYVYCYVLRVNCIFASTYQLKLSFKEVRNPVNTGNRHVCLMPASLVAIWALDWLIF